MLSQVALPVTDSSFDIGMVMFSHFPVSFQCNFEMLREETVSCLVFVHHPAKHSPQAGLFQAPIMQRLAANKKWRNGNRGREL